MEQVVWWVAVCATVGLLIFLFQYKTVIAGRHRHRRSTIALYRLWALIVMVCCFLIAAWQPRRWVTTSDQDVVWFDVMVMLDVSQSMLVTDINYAGTQASRLDAAKTMIAKLVERAPWHRRWLGVFAWEALWISPLTSDTDVFLTFLAWVDRRNLRAQWTSISQAIDVAVWRFDSDEERARVLLVVSDGGDQEDSLDPVVVNQLQDAWVYVVAVGVWTIWGWQIPIPQNQFGWVTYKTYQWETVISTYDNRALRALTNQTDWLLVRLQNNDGLDRIVRLFSGIEKTAVQRSPQSQPRVFSRWFVWVGLLALLVFVALFDVRVQRIIKNE